MTYPDDFLMWLRILEPAEGVFSDDPDDRGGQTWYGISERSHPEILQVPIGKRRARAREIAFKDYWEKTRCDEIQWPLCLVLADWAFNSGPGTAAKYLQALVGVPQDGVVGNETVEAVTKACSFTGPVALARKLHEARVRYVANLVQHNASQVKFLEGWMVRLNTIATRLN